MVTSYLFPQQISRQDLNPMFPVRTALLIILRSFLCVFFSPSETLGGPSSLIDIILTLILTGVFSHLSTVTISFHNEVSSQHIRLFDDARSLKYERDSLYVSLDGRTSQYFAAWGSRGFTSGKQYWEVDVESSWDWAVGVCKDSWTRKDDSILKESNRDNFLLVCVKEDHHYRLWTTIPNTPLYIEKPQGRVGVFLDFDSGSMGFVDVARRSLLWRYEDGLFTFPVRPFICTGHTWAGLSQDLDWMLRTPSLREPFSAAANQGNFIVFRLFLLQWNLLLLLFVIKTVSNANFVCVFHLPDKKACLTDICLEYVTWLFTCVVSLLNSPKCGRVLPTSWYQYRNPGLTQHGQTWSPTRPTSAPNFLLLPHDLLCPTHQFTLRMKTDLTEKSPLTLETG